MLVKCPKCSFSQPQDQYCAQCGVDMMSYKPPQKSALATVLKDPLFHLTLVIILSVTGAVTLYRKNKNASEQPTTYYTKNTNFPQQRSIASQSPDTIPAKPTVTEEIQPRAITAYKAVGTGTESTTLSHGTASRAEGEMTTLGAAALPAAKSDKTKSAYKAKVIYAEMNSRIYDSLIEESSKTGQFNNFGDYAAGIIPQIQKKLSLFARDINILRTDLDPIELGKSLNWSFNYHGSEREPASTDISFSTFVNLEGSDSQVFKGNLEIIRSQKDSVNPTLSSIQKSNYPAVFELGADAAFFMSGLGIHRNDGTTKPETEFVVLVQFEKAQ